MFKDEYSKFISVEMTQWENHIYDIEDHISALEDNVPALVEYLKDLQYSMTLGLGLRRYLSAQYGTEVGEHIVLRFPDGTERIVKNYKCDGYDILKDDTKTYADLFLQVNQEYNQDALSKEFPRPEVNRLLRAVSACTRQKLFLLSFALHMGVEDTHWFLTSVLAEQTYNMRKPEEIIAYFCHSHEEANHYAVYLRLLQRYKDEISADADTAAQPMAEYTKFARGQMEFAVKTEEDLMDFLRTNRGNFTGFSQTAYAEFMRLYEKAKNGVVHLPEDEEDSADRSEDEKDSADRSTAYKNTEQLAKDMISFVPRYTHEYERGGKKVIENEYIPIYNGERGQKSKKVQTTTLPKEITRKLMVRDRLDDLIAQKIPVERKDLVFMKFFVFYRINEKEAYSAGDYKVFMDECNAMLVRCGMSHLYPGNRFENLILLSMLAENPFEMFENIIDATFMNEPGPDAAEV